MKEHPVPVMMISSLTQQGAKATIEAMHAGAVDFIGDLLCLGLIAGKVDGDFRPFVCQLQRDRAPDAARSACYQCGSSVDPSHFLFSRYS